MTEPKPIPRLIATLTIHREGSEEQVVYQQSWDACEPKVHDTPPGKPIDNKSHPRWWVWAATMVWIQLRTRSRRTLKMNWKDLTPEQAVAARKFSWADGVYAVRT